MTYEDENVHFLVKTGFTLTEARLYITLLKAGKTDAGTIQKLTKVPRPAVYRALNDLLDKGFIEKEIAMPNNFKALPIHLAMQIVVKQKKEECREIEKKTAEFLEKFREFEDKNVQEPEYKFTVLNGRERIIQKMKQQHDKAKSSVDILSTLPRWLQIVEECFDNYKRALSRGVKYRVIVETPESKPNLTKEVQTLLESPNFKLKITSNSRKTNSAIFDKKEATFNFFPSKIIAESPLIWTNHPSFMTMCQDHFTTTWKSARKFNP